MHCIQRSLYLVCLFAGASAAAGLSGNWVASQDMHDGTYRRTYLNLRHQDGRISGTIRATQFFYTIVESTGGPEGFTITGRMMDGATERRVQYQGKLIGDELHVATRRRADAPHTEMVAHRAPEGEGAIPARIEPTQLHKVPDNGLVRTPPMGWNSWNKFAGRITADDVRSMADGVAIEAEAFEKVGLAPAIQIDAVRCRRDRLGTLVKFVPPTVVAGKVYIPNYDDGVNVYGLLP